MPPKPYVLGLAASHNGAAALLEGEALVAAIQEERLSRQKRAQLQAGRPSLATRYCLQSAGIQPESLAMVVLCPRSVGEGPAEDLYAEPFLAVARRGIPVVRIGHHFGHAMAAYATSGFRDTAVLVVDGSGTPFDALGPEDRAVAVGAGRGKESISAYRAVDGRIEPLFKHFTDGPSAIGPGRGGLSRFYSLGGMFSAISLMLFGDHEAGKVMGLAAYGRATIPAEEFFVWEGDGLRFTQGVVDRFPIRRRWPEDAGVVSDLAASAQVALEDAIVRIAVELRARSGCHRLCYAGGVALNCQANERLIREAGFGEVFIMPAAEDSGTAIGAAHHGLTLLQPGARTTRLARDSVGATYSREAVESAGAAPGIEWSRPTSVAAAVAEALAGGDIVGWFSGGSELGPRALGQRSLLCDPRRADAKEVLNARVKFREAFRPFAPVVLEEHAEVWFRFDGSPPESPFMLRSVPFRADKAALVPAVVHQDGTGRLQTLRPGDSLYEVTAEFHRRTQIPMLLNTSLNTAGEPIAETPEDALWLLLGTEIDGIGFDGIGLARRRPSTGGILDRVPRLRARRWSLGVDVAASGFEISASAELEIVVSTPWGEGTRSFPATLLPVLRSIDGRSTGRELLARWTELGLRLGDQEATRLLLTLRGARVIDLTLPAESREEPKPDY